MLVECLTRELVLACMPVSLGQNCSGCWLTKRAYQNVSFFVNVTMMKSLHTILAPQKYQFYGSEIPQNSRTSIRAEKQIHKWKKCFKVHHFCSRHSLVTSGWIRFLFLIHPLSFSLSLSLSLKCARKIIKASLSLSLCSTHKLTLFVVASLSFLIVWATQTSTHTHSY